MEKQNNLNRLLRRRQQLLQLVNKITQSKDEENDEATTSKAKLTPSPKNKGSDSTVASEFSENINETIEDSDNDNPEIGKNILSARERKLYLSGKTLPNDFSSNHSPRQEKNKENFEVYSSSDTSDMINTSTVSFQLNHSFFNDSSDTSKNFRVPGVDQNREQTPEPPKKRPKISIISDEIISRDVYLSKYSIQPTTTEDQYEPEKEATYFNLCNVKDISTSINLICNPSPSQAKTDTCTDANLQDLALNTCNSEPIADNTLSENIWNRPGTSYDLTADWNQPGTSRDYTEGAHLLGSSNPDNSPDENKSISELKKHPKRKRKQEFKRAHIDFMSDDEFNAYFPENEDFSPDSSDVWSMKESEESDTSNKSQVNKNKSKKKLTKKKEKPIETKEQEKTVKYKKENRDNKRKTMKIKREKGESYETSKGTVKEAKKLQPNPCQPGKCPRECFEVLEERRQRIFDYFWNLDIQRKRDWLVHCASRVPIKRKKTDSFESKRKCTYEYYINEGEGRRQICQQFLLKTLDITQNFLLYTLYNAQEEGLSQEEQRRQPKNNTRKYDESTVTAAKEYIESLPLLPSHYCRPSSDRLYLPQEYKTLTNLYRLYRKSCEQKGIHYLSDRVFINLFHTEYNNVTIHVPKKDKCNICAKNENNPNDAEKNKQKIKIHIEEETATYERFISHQNYSGKMDTLVASFDLQKILNTPHGDNILLFYSRKYTVYNFTVYESSTQNGFCYVWGECDGKRGAKEIGSCLFKYLKDVDGRGIRKLILYCDACPGQNRNRTILSLLHYFLSISKNIETIQLNFLLTGHSYMPVDSMHSVIEREVRKLTVWSYTQWPSYMESARKNPRPYVVTVLDHTDFIDWDPVTETMLPSKMKDLQVTKIRIATMKKKTLQPLRPNTP